MPKVLTTNQGDPGVRSCARLWIIHCICLALAVLQVSCHRFAPASAYLTEPPPRATLVGVYAPATDGVWLATELPGEFPSGVELRADGTVLIAGVPSAWRTKAMGHQQSQGLGRWEVNRYEESWAVAIVFKIAGEASIEAEEAAVEAIIMGNSPPHTLLFESQTKIGRTKIFTLQR